MNTHILAAMLNGCEYTEEITRELEVEAKKHGLVVVFGGSDDLIEFRGAIHDERGAPGNVQLTSAGLLENKCEDEGCPYFELEKKKATVIEALWDSEGYSWTYRTAIPHATFEVLESGEPPYCRGIVFALADVCKTAPNTDTASLSARLSAAAGLLAGHGHKDSVSAVFEARDALLNQEN
jgi:hypothetical protein